MKYPFGVLWCLFSIFIFGVASAQNIPAPSASIADLPGGKVQAFIVQGNVSLVDKDGKQSSLKRGQVFGEGVVIKAGRGSSALLVFSNGVVLKILENCQISVDQFKQVLFDEKSEGTYLQLKKDPSKSVVTLDLRNARAEIVAPALDDAAGSSFTINSPAGSFSVHEGIFSISVVRNSAGQVAKILGNSYVGMLSTVLSGAASKTTSTTKRPNALLPESQIQTHLNVDPITGAIVNPDVIDARIPQDYSQKAIDAIYASLNSARADNSLGPLPPPKASPPTQPAGWLSMDFDPDTGPP